MHWESNPSGPTSARRKFRLGRRIFVTTCAAAIISLPVHGQDAGTSPEAKTISKTEQLRQEIVSKGLAFLAKEGQSEQGTFSDRVGPGVTALAITSALRNGQTIDDPMVAEGLKALEGYVKPDGGIYGNGRLKNYETCVAMVCFAEANKTGQYNEILKRAKAFVTGIQYGEGTKEPSDPWYGGVGYGGAGRPDLSNTGYMIEALRAVETPASDPAIQRALVFISRCQNLDSEFNDTQFADKVDDGGFYYEIPTTKIDPSTSEERFTPNGGLRSYGSMGYTGLKSMIFAGLTKEDPRVKAAQQWIQDHYSVEKNPGMGTAGLYYYYHTFAAALDAAGLKTVADSDGKEHDWKADLVAELAERQNEDGSWSNDNQRWFENDKNLATSFALMALGHCQ
ncbi:prenyltransferase/squalene oxidase repeat-containing protein [Rhodopirellula baltica]